jgi:tetratricopeptide (TPR) repeat protein
MRMFDDTLISADTKRRLSLGAAAGFLLAPTARAEEPGVVSVEAYRNELDIKREEAWILREIRELRSQPYLERAYRAMTNQDWAEARRELEDYLSLSPQDLQARATLLTVLTRVNDPAASIAHAEQILNERPQFVPALIFRGLAHQAHGNAELAIADLNAAAHSPSVRLEDRQMALNLVAELALKERLYQPALTALDELKPDRKYFDWHFKHGIALAGLGHLNEARESYREAFRLAPNLGERAKASQALGEIAKSQQDWEEARRAFTTAHDLDPGDTQLMRTLAEIADSRRDYKEAADWMRRTVSARPAVEDRAFLANSLYALRDYQGAIHELTALLPEVQEKEQRYRTYLALGHAYTQLKEYRKAADAFQEAAGITADLNTLLTLAQVREKSGQIGMAIASLEQALPHSPTAELHDRLGKLNLKNGARADALRHFEEALRSPMPDNADQRYRLQMGLGADLFKLRQPGRAAEAYRQALATRNTREARLALAKAEEGAGRTQDAITALLDSQHQQPHAETHLKLGSLYAKTGDEHAAMNEIREATNAKAPVRVRAKALLLQGRLEYKNGDFQAAHESFSKALELRPRSAEALARLGETEIKLQQYQEAINHLERSLSLRHSAKSLRNLALAHTKLNHWDKAAAVNRRLLSLQRLRPALRRETLANLRSIDRQRQAAAKQAEAQDLAITPVHPSRHGRLAAEHFVLGNWDDALDEFARIPRHEAKAEILRDMARCYEELHQPRLAIEYLNKALVHKDQLSSTEQKALHKRLGELHDQTENRVQAAHHYGEAVRLKPDPALSLRLGRAQRLHGQHYHAKRTLEGIPEKTLAPTLEAQRQDELAEIYLRQQQAKQAIEALKRASTLAPAADREYKLGQLYWKRGEWQQAMPHFRAAYVRDFKNPEYTVALANAYHATGRHKDASRLFKTVVDKDPKHRGVIRQMDSTRGGARE